MKIKKTWKLIIILLIVPLLLFGVLLVYLQSNQSDIIQKEIAKLNQSYDGLISVGESQLAIFENFPYISIKVEDVHIYEAKKDNSPEILNVKDIYVGFNLFDILQGNYDIQSLLIEDGDFNIVLLKNQTTNIQNSLTNAAETTTSTASSGANIHLKKIELKNLDIHTYVEETDTYIENYIYSAKGGFQQTNNAISGHIDSYLELNVLKNNDTTFIKKKQIEIHTDITFDEKTGILDIAPSGIVMENGDFELEGSIDSKNDLDLDLFIKGTKPNFDMFIAFAPSELVSTLEKYRNAGEIYFNASVKGPASNGKTPFINANFGASKAFLENTTKDKKIDDMGFKGHFSNGENRDLSTSSFSLSNMTASLEKGQFKGSILVHNFESPEVEMQIDSNFSLNFIAEFLELEQVQNASGQISLKMNFHDIIDFDQPEKALQSLNQAYFAELNVKDLSFEAENLPAPLDNLDIELVMNGKKASLNTFDLTMGNSDVSVSGFISDLPAVVHHTDIPVNTHFDIASKTLDIAQLTGFSIQDSISTGMDEQIQNLSLGFSFKSSAKAFTESKYLPHGEFFIDSLYAELTHYPHKLNGFYADILIDEKDLKVVDFKGNIDESDFQFNGLIHDYSFWMQPELNGDVDLDFNLKSNSLKLNNLLTYKGKNYLPEEYREEEFKDLALHFFSGMHYKDSTLQSIDIKLDELTTKMTLHPLKLTNFRGDIHYEDEHIVIQDFHGEIGKTNFDFDLNYYLGENQLIKKRDNYFALKADYIDFDALFSYDSESSAPTEVVASTTEDVKEHAESFNIYELPFTDMRFKADISHFIYHKLDLQNIISDFRITPDHYIYIDTLQMDAAGGKISLNGYFNGSDPKHIYFQPDLKLENIDLDKMLFKFENFGQDYIVSDNLKGRLSSRIKGKIRVYPDMVPDLDQSEMEMDVKILNGRLKNYNPMLALSDYMGDKNLQNIRFDTLQNSLAIHKGKLNIPNMTIESTLGHMEFAGTHDNNNKIDYYLRIPWKTVKKAAWQKLTGRKEDTISNADQEDKIIEIDPDKKIRYLNLKIKGSVDDYKISLGKKKSK